MSHPKLREVRTKRPVALFLLALAGVVAFPAVQRAQGRAAQPATKPLVVYVVDTEGGKAALYVSPTGQTLLIDSGNPGGRDTDRASGQERVVRYFERFQRVVAKAWKNELARWMQTNGGFIQYGAKPAAVDLLPERAVERLLTCQNAAAVEWIFVGRWLFLDKADDAAILRDRAKLARTIDETLRALLPIWLATYSGSD